MKFSFWELDSWFSNIDFTIVGSGLTGLNCALRLRERFPNAKIVVLERGVLPNGASTKNAGFACFGSMSEILDDLRTHTEQEVVELVSKRKKGLELLRGILGDSNINYKRQGGYEVFSQQDEELYADCMSKINSVNTLLKSVFKEDVFRPDTDHFGFQEIQERLIFNRYEGQLDTGKMMMALLKKVQHQGIQVLNNIKVQGYTELNSQVEVQTDYISFKTKKLMIATNGFASQLGLAAVKPARAQVLITGPIDNLKIKGTFHYEKGYYYFRDVGNRILLGGGRNLDFQEEETTEIEVTERIQSRLEELLERTILPGKSIAIEHRWSGIMGVGAQKKPVVRTIGNHVYCGVRLGGMGVAIGSSVGQELADLVE